MKKIFTFLFSIFTLFVFAQAPANDECQIAVNLGKAPACPNTVFTNVNATKTNIGDNNNPFCSSDGNVDKDVWFTFIASDTIYDYTISIKSSGATGGIVKPNVNIYRGGCGLSNLIKICPNSPTISNSEYTFNLYGLSPGETYYIRVSDSNTAGNFNVCVTEIKSITIDQGSTTACAGFLYDSGGSNGNYKNNENFTFKICPSDPHKCIKLDFTYYNIANDGDEMVIYDGPDTNSPIVATIDGSKSKGTNGGAVAYSVYAKSGCMTIKFTSDSDVNFEGFEAYWQCSPDECITPKPIVVNSNTTSQDIINSVSANGTLVKLDTIICDKRAYATFSGIKSDLGMDKGLILSSGSALGTSGKGSDFMSLSLGKPGDADLDLLSTQASQDACVVEFDVFASTDEINFEYVFGSEEYPVFVNSFNDIFAFMISGPGIVGDPALGTKKNMAIVPNTSSPVEINSVNTNKNWEYFRDNANGQSVVYNGLTSDKFGVKKTLTARSSVTPCKTYKLKMAIADRGDNAYDSGVFVSDIKGAAPEVTFVSPNKIDYLIEKCSGVNDKVKISLYKPLANDATFAVKIGGTATNNVDYTFGIPNAITFPAGSTELSFPLLPIADNTMEGVETITITLSRDFGCGSVDLVTKTININDQLDIKIEAGVDTISICAAGEGTQVTATGASFYTWTPASIFNNPQIEDPIVKPLSSQKIYVTGQVGTCIGKDSSWAQIFNPSVKIKALTATDVCEGEIIKLEAENNVNDQNLTWGPTFVDFLPDNTSPVVNIKSFFSTSIYVLAEAGGCTVGDTIDITVAPINMPFVFPDTTVCEGYPVLLASNSFSNSTFVWTPKEGLNDPNVTNAIATPSKTTTYILTGTSPDGLCVAKDTIVVTVKTNNVFIQGADTIHICKGDSLVLNAKTSSQADTSNFKWTSKSVSFKNSKNTTTKGFVHKTGWVYASFNSSGCLATDSIYVIKDSLPSDLLLHAIKEQQPYCQGDTVLLYSNSVLKPNYPKATFLWVDPVSSAISPLTNVNLLLQAQKSTSYYRTITNGACVRKDTFTMTVLPVIKPIGLKDTAVCSGQIVKLNITNAKDYSSLEWNPASGLSCSDCANPTVTNGGSYTVTAKVQGKCPTTATVNINIKPNIISITPFDPTVCQGTAVNIPLTINPATLTNIVWTPSSGLSCNNCSNPTATKIGEYAVTGLLNGCTANSKIKITQLDTTMTLSKPSAICDGEAVIINLENPNNYTNLVWTPSAGLNCNNCPNPTASKTGTYTLKATKYGKCSSTQKVTITAGSKTVLTMTASPSQLVSSGDKEVKLTVTGDANFDNGTVIWDTPGLDVNGDKATLSVSNIVKTITINAKGFSKDGCEAKTSINIYKILFPLVLLPESSEDSKFQFIDFPYNVLKDENIESLTIFNRWSEIVYKETNITKANEASKAWNCNYNSKSVPTDVYKFIMKAKLTSGETVKLTGEITVLH